MLGSLFQNGWQSDSAESRLAFIAKAEASSPKSQEVFTLLARQDNVLDVRLAALNKITDAVTVFDISQSHDDLDTRKGAKQAFAKLIGIKGSISEDQLRALSVAKPDCIAGIIQHGPYADLRADLIGGLAEITLAEIVGEVNYTETRCLIAERLETLDALELARKDLKGKDKNAEKIVKDKIDEIHKQQKLERENVENALLLCEKMEYLADHLAPQDWRAEFKGQFNVWQQRWSEMNFVPADDIEQRYRTAYKKVSVAVAQISKVSNAQQGQSKLCQQIEQQCKLVADQTLEMLTTNCDELDATVASLVCEWESLTSIAPAEPNLEARFQAAQLSLYSAIQFCRRAAESENDLSVLNNAIKSLNWQQPELSLRSLSEIQTVYQDLKTQANKAERIEKDELDKLHKRINRLLGVTKQGHLPRAKRELEVITKKIEAYAGKERSILDERLVKANEIVAKMVDWNNFVTEPKYLELCAAMEALIEVKTKPDKLAKQIHELQEQWKKIGYSDSSESHWPRFKTAADKAYQPCDEFFKQRQETRKANLAKREPYLAQMKSLWEDTNWDDTPDYKSIEKNLRNIMQDWQKIKDVEHHSGQKQWKKLTDYKSKINKKLDVVFDANIESRNQIISQTKALLESDVDDQTIKKLQLFQSRWKQVGITRRNQDQIAWRKFKKVSDAVYEEIQGLRKQERAQEDEQINQYRQAIKQIQNLAKQATELADSDKQFEQLQVDYNALPELPKNLPEKLIKSIAADFRRACDNYNKTRDRIIQSGRSKVIDQLAQKASLCGQLELAAATDNSSEIERLQSEIDELIIEDKTLAKQIDARIKNSKSCDFKKAEAARRQMCIDLEILLDIDSPNEDKALRMQIQLERMKNKGLGQSLEVNNKSIEKQRIDWLCLPGAAEDTQKTLDDRFKRLLKNAAKQA
ncbi:MAG: DUF349 domain-containing protein [Acidiferrobacterales bacterium]|nr:DUF349 domain-containing protein [Acidiferrobacterales bacterium]